MIKSGLKTIIYSLACLGAVGVGGPLDAKPWSDLRFDCSVSYHSYTNLRYDDFMKTEDFESDFYVKKGEKIQLTIVQHFSPWIDNAYVSQFLVEAKRHGEKSSFNSLEQNYKRYFKKSSFMSEFEYRVKLYGDGYMIRYRGYYDLEVEVDPEFFRISGHGEEPSYFHTYFKKQSNNRWRGSISNSHQQHSSHVILDCLFDETDGSYEKWMFKSQLWLEKLPTEPYSE